MTSLSLTDALRLTGDIARGLHAAHIAGIVHRDVKPANIFLSSDGRAQVGDFGIAQIDNLSRRTHFTFGHPGTPLYMSPEQASSTAYVRPISDEYSLGLVLFEMLTGEVYRRIGRRDAAALLARQPKSVVDLVTRMLAEDPDDRYHTLGAVEGAVREIKRQWSSLTTARSLFHYTPKRHDASTPPEPPTERDTPPLPQAGPVRADDVYANMPHPASPRLVVPVPAPVEMPPLPPVPPPALPDAEEAEQDVRGIVPARSMRWAIPIALLMLLGIGIFGYSALNRGGDTRVTATPFRATVTPIQAQSASPPPAAPVIAADGAGRCTAGQDLLARGDYAGAANAFAQAGDYRDATRQASLARTLADQQAAYDAGVAALDRKEYTQAAQSFTAAGQVKDAPRAYAYRWQAGEACTPNFWGPLTTARDGQAEPYVEGTYNGTSGQRLVQYFDKARMELTNPATSVVTSGLLAT